MLYSLRLLAGVLGVDKRGDVEYIGEWVESDIDGDSWAFTGNGGKELPA